MSVEAFQELGSLSDYLERHSLTDSPEAHHEYFTVIVGLRKAHAIEIGISLEELHSSSMSYSEAS